MLSWGIFFLARLKGPAGYLIQKVPQNSQKYSNITEIGIFFPHNLMEKMANHYIDFGAPRAPQFQTNCMIFNSKMYIQIHQ